MMSKLKFLYLSTLVFVFLSLTTAVHAQLGDRLENRQEKMETRQVARSDVAEKHANSLEQRFTNYYSRLSLILTRFQAHLASIDPAKKDITFAKSKLADAQIKLEEAKTLGATAVSLFRGIDPAKWSEQKTQALAARDSANQAIKAFKDAHALMVEAMRSLKSINAK